MTDKLRTDQESNSSASDRETLRLKKESGPQTGGGQQSADRLERRRRWSEWGAAPSKSNGAAQAQGTSRETSWNRYGASDPLVGPGTAKGNPGAMTMAAKVQLHSRLAINLFRGRKADPANSVRGIIGLARFGRQVAQVWSAAANDDPYADQCLVNIEAAFDEAQEILANKLRALQELLGGMEDFTVDMQTSMQPVEVDLQFFCPWGFRASVLLRDFDRLVRMALTANHLGLFADGDWMATVHESQRALRHMFALVDDWLPTNVKRADIRANTKMARRAKARYVERRRHMKLEPDVLEGQKRAKLAPASRILEEYQAEMARKAAVAAQAGAAKDVAKSVAETGDAGDHSVEAEKVKESEKPNAERD